ncbi:MAG: NrfD/PsrC family molybdoenzyme membrane anchor subunit, partial [Acidobacteriaceae bacterium]
MSERPLSIAQAAREARLVEIRKEAEAKGRVEERGIRPAGSPFPLASPQTGYYKVPMLKEPQWSWAVPLYFFVGGASGSLGVIGSLADVIGDHDELAEKARWLALGGAGLSSVLLIYDLGRPARFLNMLRIFKPQSAMSVGSYVLSAFSTFAAASSFADLLRMKFGDALPVKLISGAGRVGSTLFGMPFHN